jgi:hypothetical protein
MNLVHIPLAQRKAICGRLLFFQAAPNRLAFLGAGAESEFDQVRDNLFKLTEQGASSSQDNEPLDTFLQRLLTDFGYQMQPQLRGKHGILFQPLYALLESSIKAFSCNQCSPLRPHICDGGSKDDAIVSTGGACIAPIRVMFDIAAQATKTWYSQCCNLFNPQQAPALMFSTSFRNSKPHDIPGDYFVGGVTKPHAHPQLIAEIDLCLWPKKFDWNTYAVLLYVLFHECICHAYQGMRAFRPKPVTDGFSEGWMDWIAFECFRRHIQQSPPTTTLQAYLDSGTKFHLLRVDYNDKERSDQASISAFGRSVAQKFAYMLERLPESASDPWSNLLMTSFDINVAGGLSDKELAILDKYLTEKGALDAPLLDAATESIRNYLKSKDIYHILKFLI